MITNDVESLITCVRQDQSCETKEWKHGPERQGVARENSLLKQRITAPEGEGLPETGMPTS